MTSRGPARWLRVYTVILAICVAMCFLHFDLRVAGYAFVAQNFQKLFLLSGALALAAVIALSFADRVDAKGRLEFSDLFSRNTCWPKTLASVFFVTAMVMGAVLVIVLKNIGS